MAWIVALAIAFAGCTRDRDPHDRDGRRVFRVGVMPNMTHAPGLLGFQSGLFRERLGNDVVVKDRVFTAGPSVIEALFAGDLDVAYIGPNPAVNGYFRSNGKALRLIAGAASGGAALVVKPRIHGPQDLVGEKVASPAIANTQDVSLRFWLRDYGLKAKSAGGNVEVLPVTPADIFSLFGRDRLAAAWVPEPWVSRLVLEAGGVVLVDERSLWPDGKFPTTVVIASTDALKARPDLVDRFLAANREAIRRLQEDPGPSRSQVQQWLNDKGKKLRPDVVKRAFDNITFTDDPLFPQIQVLARRAVVLGDLPTDEGIEGIRSPP
ncbi:ABC transporter substrate-binding protein [Vulgatibacter incomptus]|uniref:ABC transporter substrate-binding protein n=1 Tax=Vulgatibacter incomptus TaxID=1391653 RepID=UPI00196A0F73|nr:ABC transporter substrate-binding protein [Vulgatibacter incomptus]